MSAVLDQNFLSQEQDTKPAAGAGFWSFWKRRPKSATASPQEPFLDPNAAPTKTVSMDAFLNSTADPLRGRQAPTFDNDFGSPAATSEPAAEAAPVNSQEVLARELLQAFDQSVLDDTAFEAVRHLQVVQMGGAAETGKTLVLFDPVSNDGVRVGAREDGAFAVVGLANITAAQALNRAQIALNNDRMRSEGIDELAGTDLDKALLMLAANRLKLTIHNPPQISAAVQLKAEELWAEMLAEKGLSPEVPVAKAPAAPDTTEVAGFFSDAPAPVTRADEPSLAEVPRSGDITDVEVKVPVNTPAPLPADDIPTLTDVLSDAEAQQMLRNEPPTPEEREIVQALGESHALKPEVRKALAGNTPNESVNPLTYIEFRDQVKAGNSKLYTDQVFLNVRGICDEFKEKGIGTGGAHRLVEALKADNLAIDADQVVLTPGVKTVVNYQVPARPVVFKPIQTLS